MKHNHTMDLNPDQSVALILTLRTFRHLSRLIQYYSIFVDFRAFTWSIEITIANCKLYCLSSIDIHMLRRRNIRITKYITILSIRIPFTGQHPRNKIFLTEANTKVPIIR